jgi:D-arabinose 1-dehydrogenase-like Zn-dependent alcohol dehydrogenase
VSCDCRLPGAGSATIDIRVTLGAWLTSRTAKQGELRESDYKPKPFEADDVDIAIMYTGVCWSDLSTMSSGWSDVDYPLVG